MDGAPAMLSIICLLLILLALAFLWTAATSWARSWLAKHGGVWTFGLGLLLLIAAGIVYLWATGNP